jgi:NOL1/NOP2/sun family putative RNA methylase
MLPEAFTDRMKELLGGEYQDFLQSYEKTKYQALRFNPLKGESGRFLALTSFSLSPVPWAENGFYYEEGDRPGKHPYHEAGVYYIQEASAMAPAAYLEAEPGEKILDLCAAPGGKSTQIAGAMQGEGILICNEIHPARAKILSENIERLGIGNAIVVNHSPDVLAEHFPAYFDRILVDAPCSGEGMFRKNEEACREWSPENVHLCAKRQDEILDAAALMLHPGGRLVYSTCTFAPEENEGSISRFLNRHPEFEVLPVKKLPGMESGRPDWITEPAQGIEHTLRLWPHKLAGEGHFLAVLQKQGRNEKGIRKGRYGFCQGILPGDCRDYLDFQKEYLDREMPGIPVRFGEQLYLLPEAAPSLNQLKVLRPGLHLGTCKKNRFEPGHALAHFLKPEDVYRHTDLVLEGGLAEKYLAGQTLETTAEDGWQLICVDGYSLGFGKAVKGIIKNHYPKGLRKNL